MGEWWYKYIYSYMNFIEFIKRIGTVIRVFFLIIIIILILLAIVCFFGWVFGGDEESGWLFFMYSGLLDIVLILRWIFRGLYKK